MALDVLVQGKLVKAPERRTTRTGSAYALASVSVAMGDEGDILANVIAFRTEAVDALLALDKGDACAIAGSAKVGTWTRDGETKASLSITAEAVLSVYAARRKRAAVQGDADTSDGPTPAPAPDRGAKRVATHPRALPAVAGSIADMADDTPF